MLKSTNWLHSDWIEHRHSWLLFLTPESEREERISPELSFLRLNFTRIIIFKTLPDYFKHHGILDTLLFTLANLMNSGIFIGTIPRG